VSLIRYHHNANTGILDGQQDFCLPTGDSECLPTHGSFHGSIEFACRGQEIRFCAGVRRCLKGSNLEEFCLVNGGAPQQWKFSAEIPSIVE
jgi:hypothetical protein